MALTSAFPLAPLLRANPDSGLLRAPGPGNDTVDGDSSDDFLSGLGGNDVLNGKGGVDTMSGGAGNDRLFGGGGNDDMVGLNGRDTLFGGADNDLMEGNGAADFLFGDGGLDLLAGGNGADRLRGDAGNDFLIGNDGADQFVFRKGHGSDTIQDFENGIDKIRIEAPGGTNVGNFVKSKDGLDTVITNDALNIEIRLQNIKPGQISIADDFILAGF